MSLPHYVSNCSMAECLCYNESQVWLVLRVCRFVISSLDRLNLTVTVEDEYTYFSADKPNLANASVSLTSKFGGNTITLIANASGQLSTFKSLRTDLDLQLI